jgi:C-terminal processing protease CtpA/Prc
MPTIQAPTSIETGGEFNRRIGRARSLQLGRFTFPNPPISLAQNGEEHVVDGILGAEILRRFKVVFDFSHRRMILELNSHFDEPFEEDMSGVALAPENDNGQKVFRVRQVVANTPAAEAGLIEGDLITAIDNRPASEFTASRIATMFMRNGQEYLLSVKRGEKAVQIKIKLRRLI